MDLDGSEEVDRWIGEIGVQNGWIDRWVGSMDLKGWVDGWINV